MMVDPGVIAFDNEQADKRGQYDPELGKLLRRHREELTAYLRSRIEASEPAVTADSPVPVRDAAGNVIGHIVRDA
jgi:hypothetical protein